MTSTGWTEHAVRRIREAGLRRSNARQTVIEMLGEQGCALTALEIDRRLPGVGRATVYRAVEQLEELGLIRRVDVGTGTYGFEKIDPTGDHHHHLVCDICGKVEPFADQDLEKAIRDLSPEGFRVESHEITLKGICRRCR